VEKFFRQHHCREEHIAERLEDIKNALPATSDEAIVAPSKHMMAAWVGQMGVLRNSVREIEKEIRELARQQDDWVVFDSFPGAGDVMAPRLMAALGTRRDRFESASDLQCLDHRRRSLAGLIRIRPGFHLCLWSRNRTGKGSEWQ
jgi:hypothetical protein